MYKAIYEYFEKELDCSYLYIDTHSIFMKIIIHMGGSISGELNKVSGMLSISELGRKKHEISNDTIIEACFLKDKA